MQPSQSISNTKTPLGTMVCILQTPLGVFSRRKMKTIKMTNKKLCNQRYGRKNLQEFTLRLIGGQKNKQPRTDYMVWSGYFARYHSVVGGGKLCKPTCTRSTYNRNQFNSSSESIRLMNSKKMKARDIHDHLLAAPEEIDRMIAYTTRCPTIGNHRVGLFHFDIDNHTKLPISFVNECRDLIAAIFPDIGIYWEPSTTGSGLHGYLLLSWTIYVDNQRIRQDVEQLQQLIGSITCQIPTQCNEVRGCPPLSHKRQIIKSGCGLWGKLPRPQSREEMESFLSATNSHSFCSGLISQAQDYLASASGQEQRRVVAGSHSSHAQNTAPSVSSSHPSSLSETLPSTTVGIYANVLGCTNSEQALIGVETDTFKRATKFTSHYLRTYYSKHKALPSLEEIKKGYEDAGLKIGNTDDHSLEDAYRYQSQTFDPAKCKSSAEDYIPQATEIVQKKLEENGLRADISQDLKMRKRRYTAKGRATSTIEGLYEIKEEELIQTYACMLYELEKFPDREGTWGKRQCHELVQFFGTSMEDSKKYKAIMRWIRRNKLAKLIKHQVPSFDGTGECRLYRLYQQTQLTIAH